MVFSLKKTLLQRGFRRVPTPPTACTAKPLSRSANAHPTTDARRYVFRARDARPSAHWLCGNCSVYAPAVCCAVLPALRAPAPRVDARSAALLAALASRATSRWRRGGGELRPASGRQCSGPSPHSCGTPSPLSAVPKEGESNCDSDSVWVTSSRRTRGNSPPHHGGGGAAR